jgi:L-alanine-DL-glutamate epimerase-like enolase superfamily enzyme
MVSLQYGDRDMKIQTIKTILLSLPYTAGGSKDAEAWGGTAWRTADALLVKVTTDEGLIGWGEAFGYNAIPATRAAIENMLAPMCVGRDPLSNESLTLELQQKLHIFGRGGPVTYGLSGIDIALWDIAGKAAGKPVHQLLGGCRAPKLPCYASLIRYTDPKVVAANVERALGQGFLHVKLHEIEIPAVYAARAAAGDDIAIMLDVNCPWSLREALDMTERLLPYNLRWLEEPVWPPENYAGLAHVRGGRERGDAPALPADVRCAGSRLRAAEPHQDGRHLGAAQGVHPGSGEQRHGDAAQLLRWPGAACSAARQRSAGRRLVGGVALL